jgi:hypothetical protein
MIAADIRQGTAPERITIGPGETRAGDARRMGMAVGGAAGRPWQRRRLAVGYAARGITNRIGAR